MRRVSASSDEDPLVCIFPREVLVPLVEGILVVHFVVAFKAKPLDRSRGTVLGQRWERRASRSGADSGRYSRLLALSTPSQEGPLLAPRETRSISLGCRARHQVDMNIHIGLGYE